MAEDTSEWRYDVDEVGEDAEPERPEPEPIEPESISTENALFVAAGAIGTVLVFVVATL
jgi:hypothetical protein